LVFLKTGGVGRVAIGGEFICKLLIEAAEWNVAVMATAEVDANLDIGAFAACEGEDSTAMGGLVLKTNYI
jgi:hypothetical protein